MDVIKIEDTWYTASEIVAYKKRADEYESLKATADDFVRTIDKLKERISERDDSLIKVREWFRSLVWEDSDTALIEKELTNNLLDDIGLEGLSSSWSASVIIYATVNNYKADYERNVKDLIIDNINITIDDDADIWIEDIEVSQIEADRS